MASSTINNPSPKIPNPPRLPYLGNLHLLSAKAPLQQFMRMSEKYGPIFRIYTPIGSVVITSGYIYVKELCDESRFEKYLLRPLILLRDLAGDALFTAANHEPNWQRAHNILRPGLGQRAIRGYYPRMLEIAQQLMEKWEAIPEGKPFDLTEDMTRLTFDTIGLCGFDFQLNSFQSEEPHPFVEAMRFALSDTMQRTNKTNIQRKLRFRQNKKYKQSLVLMNKTVDTIIQERKDKPELYLNKTDLLSLMLNARDTQSGEKLSDLNIRYQILTFLIAGHETTSGLLSFAFYYLAQHPEIMQRAFDEVDQVLGGDTSKMPTYKQISELSYIRKILSETLRLWPTAPGFGLFAKEDTVLGPEAYPVAKGQPFIVLSPMLHRDAEVWGPEAEVFNPENFSNEAVRTRDPDAYKPFGNGIRACIGRQFAILEAALIMGLILQKYRLHLPPNYQLKIEETLTLKPSNLMVRLEKRKEEDRKLSALPKTAAPHKESRTASAKTQETLLIAYGSNMGASESLAEDMSQYAQDQGISSHVTSLDLLSDTMPESGYLLIVSATYNGFPPDNARKFEEYLKKLPEGTVLSDLQYTVLGCGNTQWATFQSFPRWIDERLESLGAQRICTRGEADANADFDQEVEDWYGQFWPALFQKLGLEESPKEGEQADKPFMHWCETKKDITEKATLAPKVRECSSWEVIENKVLSHNLASGRVKEVRDLVLQVPVGMTYQAGEHVAVYPVQNKELVLQICEYFGVAPEACFSLQASPGEGPHPKPQEIISVFDYLSHFVELQSALKREHLSYLSALNPCPPEQQILEAWEADRELFEQEVSQKNLNLWQFLKKFPATQISFEAFLRRLPPMQARYFSVSSSPRQHPNRLSLTVGVLKEKAWYGEGLFQGACTQYLAKLGPGDQLSAFIPKLHSTFFLPADASIPLILVAAGTGIAPMRSFIEERLGEEDNASAPIYLFFGCRYPEEDFLYKNELEAYQAKGSLKIFPAYSRIAENPMYVQDKLRQHPEAVRELIKAGAWVYVCGNAQTMAPSVREAFQEMLSPEEWEDLQRAKKYREDIWA